MKAKPKIPNPLFRAGSKAHPQPVWMQGFGKLRKLRGETKRVQARIDEAFEPDDRP